MKKKLEAELISIAHRVLKIHNREGIAQLQQEALNLYQKLSILRFYEEHFEPAKPTIGKAELEAAIEDIKTIVPEVFDQESEAITDITIESTEVLANIAETSTEIIVEDAVEEAIEIVSSETPHPLSEIKTIEEKKEIESDFITETTKTTESFTNKLVEAAEETTEAGPYTAEGFLCLCARPIFSITVPDGGGNHGGGWGRGQPFAGGRADLRS